MLLHVTSLCKSCVVNVTKRILVYFVWN